LRPLVVVARVDEVGGLLAADAAAARAGEARRRFLPLASPRSIFGADGEEHRAARRRMSPLFEAEAIAQHRNAIEEITAAHVATWPRGRPTRLLPHMRAVVDEVFVRRLIGVDDDRRVAAMAAAIRRMLWTPGNPPLSIPGRGNGVLGAVGTAVFARRRAPLTRLLAEEIDARRRHPHGGDDVLARVLRDEPRLSTAAVIEELLALLMAAQEPAAAALTWLLERLARHPRLADRVASGTRDDPTRHAIVRESLRLRPAAIAALRRLTEPRTVAGHRLPAGVVLMVPIPLVHRDPDEYEAPDEFRPDRWLAPSPPTAYWPFGGGARRCIGELLALEYVSTIVPAVLRRVRLRTLWPRPERMVLRGTILVPHRSALATVEDGARGRPLTNRAVSAPPGTGNRVTP
jgi:cytochrome P450